MVELGVLRIPNSTISLPGRFPKSRKTVALYQSKYTVV